VNSPVRRPPNPARVSTPESPGPKIFERVFGLEEAAAMLPTFDCASVAGITVIEPSRQR
jgi:hypothetical protein